MRRPVASLLLVLLLAGFVLPIVQAQTTAPACCRRGGQHHCAAPSTPDGFRSLATCCFYRHVGLTTHGNSALDRAAAFSVSVVNTPNIDAPRRAPAIQLFARSNSQRGPPLS